MAIELSMATANDSSLAAGEVQRGKSGSGHAAHGVMSFLAQLGAAAAPAKAETQALLSGDKAQASAKHAALMAKDDTGADDDKAAATTADDSALVLAQLQLNLSTQNASPSTTAAAAASRRLADLRDAKDAGTDALAADAADPSTGAKAPAADAEDGTGVSTAASSTASPTDASSALSAALAGNGLLPLTGMSLVSSALAASAGQLGTSPTSPASPGSAAAATSASRGTAHAVLLSDASIASQPAAAANSSVATPPLTIEAGASTDASAATGAAAPAAEDKRAHSFAATTSASADSSSPTSASPSVQVGASTAVTDLDQRLRALSSLSGGEGRSMVKPAASASAGLGAASQGSSWSLSNLASTSGASTASAASANLPAGANGTVSEQQVAAQVTMWASQNIKSAELKLDAHGKDPVEVSISMTGNQAHVHFRSDVAQTRELLTRSAAALDSSMQREGLVLTGMTVGTSAQGRDSSGATGDNAPSGGKSVLRAVATVDAVSTVSASRTPQGALDLFV